MDTNQSKDNWLLVSINQNGQERVDASELHKALEVGMDFSNWIRGRIEEYGFIHGEDYEIYEGLSSLNSANSKLHPQKAIEYSLSLDMAKELAMLERNEKGRKIRQYFISVEKRTREITKLFQKLGGSEQAFTYALMGRIYQVFSGNRKIGINTMYKIMEYALAKSPLTDEYFLATDIARLVSSELEGGYSTGKSSVDRYVNEIREIVTDFGFIPNMVREPNGGYHAKFSSKERKEISDHIRNFPGNNPEK
jgi:phage anti-repressor protein